MDARASYVDRVGLFKVCEQTCQHTVSDNTGNLTNETLMISLLSSQQSICMRSCISCCQQSKPNTTGTSYCLRQQEFKEVHASWFHKKSSSFVKTIRHSWKGSVELIWVTDKHILMRMLLVQEDASDGYDLDQWFGGPCHRPNECSIKVHNRIAMLTSTGWFPVAGFVGRSQGSFSGYRSMRSYEARCVALGRYQRLWVNSIARTCMTTVRHAWCINTASSIFIQAIATYA